MDKAQVWTRLANSYLETEGRYDHIAPVSMEKKRAKAAISILSDAQELADRGCPEEANNNINAAKLLLCDMIDSMPRL